MRLRRLLAPLGLVRCALIALAGPAGASGGSGGGGGGTGGGGGSGGGGGTKPACTTTLSLAATATEAL